MKSVYMFTKKKKNEVGIDGTYDTCGFPSFQFQKRQMNSSLAIWDPKTNILHQYPLFSHYKSQDTIKARTQQSIFALNIRERYGFHAAKEDSYAQKDSYPSSPNQVLQICNVKLEITFSAFTLLLAKRDSIAQNDSHLLKL